MCMTTKQNRFLHSLLKQCGISSEEKKSLIYSFTNQRTDKSSEMKINEVRLLIAHLRAVLQQKASPNIQEKQKILGKIKALGAKYKYEPHEKVDWKNVVIPCICKLAQKDRFWQVEQMSMQGLNKVIHQLEQVIKWRERKEFEGTVDEMLEEINVLKSE